MTMVMTVVMINRNLPREDLRARIYKAAISEIRAHGFDGATIESIAARAHVAKGTLFNFYRTKLDVLIEYYWELDSRVAPFRRSLDPRTPTRSLVRYATAVERELRKESDLAVDLLTKTSADQTLSEIDRKSGDDDEREFSEFFEKCRALGTVRRDLDPAKAGALVIDVWAGSVRKWLAASRSPSLSAIFQSKLEDIFQGLAGKETL